MKTRNKEVHVVWYGERQPPIHDLIALGNSICDVAEAVDRAIYTPCPLNFTAQYVDRDLTIVNLRHGYKVLHGKEFVINRKTPTKQIVDEIVQHIHDVIRGSVMLP